MKIKAETCFFIDCGWSWYIEVMNKIDIEPFKHWKDKKGAQADMKRWIKRLHLEEHDNG